MCSYVYFSFFKENEAIALTLTFKSFLLSVLFHIQRIDICKIYLKDIRARYTNHIQKRICFCDTICIQNSLFQVSIEELARKRNGIAYKSFISEVFFVGHYPIGFSRAEKRGRTFLFLEVSRKRTLYIFKTSSIQEGVSKICTERTMSKQKSHHR